MPQRRPLLEISDNIGRGKDLTPFLRGQIEGKASLSLNIADIATELNLPRKTVSTSLQDNVHRDNGVSRQHLGRPRLSAQRHIRRILRVVRVNPRATYDVIRLELGIDWSNATLYRILKREGIIN